MQRFYIDTSVIGGIFDTEFEAQSTVLMEEIKLGVIKAVISDVTEREIMKARSEVRDFFASLPNESIELIELTPEAIKLAETYIKEEVVGATHINDCFHIALATIHQVDVLVSWNFKHIVNIYRIRGYNSVNLKLGYGTLEIRSPKDVVK